MNIDEQLILNTSAGFDYRTWKFYHKDDPLYVENFEIQKNESDESYSFKVNDKITVIAKKTGELVLEHVSGKSFVSTFKYHLSLYDFIELSKEQKEFFYLVTHFYESEGYAVYTKPTFEESKNSYEAEATPFSVDIGANHLLWEMVNDFLESETNLDRNSFLENNKIYFKVKKGGFEYVVSVNTEIDKEYEKFKARMVVNGFVFDDYITVEDNCFNLKKYYNTNGETSSLENDYLALDEAIETYREENKKELKDMVTAIEIQNCPHSANSRLSSMVNDKIYTIVYDMMKSGKKTYNKDNVTITIDTSDNQYLTVTYEHYYRKHTVKMEKLLLYCDYIAYNESSLRAKAFSKWFYNVSFTVDLCFEFVHNFFEKEDYEEVNETSLRGWVNCAIIDNIINYDYPVHFAFYEKDGYVCLDGSVKDCEYSDFTLMFKDNEYTVYFHKFYTCYSSTFNEGDRERLLVMKEKPSKETCDFIFDVNDLLKK